MSAQKKEVLKKGNNAPAKIITSENKFHVYCNHTGIGATTFDIKLIFSEILSGNSSGLTVLEHGDVTMSPQHAKAFLLNLGGAIKQYEEMFGEIKALEQA